MGNSQCLFALCSEEVPAVMGATGLLSKDANALTYSQGCWMLGVVAKAWSNRKVSLEFAHGGARGSMAVPARRVFLLELSRQVFFCLGPDGEPEYRGLKDAASELPFLRSPLENSALVRGLRVVLLSAQGVERPGTVRALRGDGQVQLDLDDGSGARCPRECVYPLSAYGRCAGGGDGDDDGGTGTGEAAGDDLQEC